MHESLLQSLGLSPEESGVYEKMLELGVAPIKKILPKSGLKRGTLYNVLRRLAEKGLITEKTGTKKTTFEVESPAALEKLMASETTRIEENKKQLADALPQLSSLYNLAMHKPNVQFFEGINGVQKVLDDSLTAKSEIYTFVDMDVVVKYIEKINKRYVEKRERLQIKKHGLVRDTQFAREYLSRYYPTVTTTRLLPGTIASFQSILQIYDDKISYLALQSDAFVGVVITHAAIAEMHKQLFLCLWNLAKPILQQAPVASATYVIQHPA